MKSKSSTGWRSKCPKDYKEHHYWQPKGIRIMSNGRIFEIWKCSQCDKFIDIEGEWID